MQGRNKSHVNILKKSMFLFNKIISFTTRSVDQYRQYYFKSNLAVCGANVFIHPTCNILSIHNMKIGSNSSIEAYTTIFAGFGVTIGEGSLISSGCGISSVNHIQEASVRHTDVTAEVSGSKPVVIGNNVWIGMNACILPGIVIGDNSIIGAGSVVTRSIPPDEIWVGNPARFVKKLHMANGA